MFKLTKRHQNNAISVVLVSLLLSLTYFAPCFTISIANFEHVIASWE